MADTVTLDPSGTPSGADKLRQRLKALRQDRPGLRARDAATALGVSEAELLALRCGDGVTRLDTRWADFVKALPDLGEVMALTRNEHVVHEKIGRFGKVSVFGNKGLVLNHDIDLRLFFDRWHFGFAAEDETKSGIRHSLQIFDSDGTAVHKIYLRRESDLDAYRGLVDSHRADDQGSGLLVLESVEPPIERPDGEIDTTGLRRRWLDLRDVHDFFGMLRDFGVGRQQAFRLVGTDLAQPVAPTCFRTALERAAEHRLPIMVFVGNPGAIQIHTGPISRLVDMRGWFNVLDPGFNLHLRAERIATAWVVRKPTDDGTVTSLEVFDAQGIQIAWMFGERRSGQPERGDWRALVESLVERGQ